MRELENEIMRAVALVPANGAVRRSRLRAKLNAVHPVAVSPSRTPGRPLRRATAAFEAGYVADALTEHGGNVSRTARAFGLSRVAFYRKLKDLGLR